MAMGKMANVRRIIPFITGGAALAALASPAMAQNGATAIATATGSVTIVQALTISKTADLGFGTIVKPTNANSSTITIAASGNGRTITGTGNAIGANNTGTTSASFLVQGEGAQHFTVTANNFNMTSGSNTLAVTVINPTGTTGLLSGNLGTLGSLVMGFGGSIVLSSATPSGAYSGSLVVQVAYN
jgi:hypothetical protein